MRYEFELIGKTALLMHSDDVEWADHVERFRNSEENQNTRKKGDDRSPAWTWVGHVYHDDERVVIPSALIMANLRIAGARHILKGSKTYKEITQTGLWIEDENCEFFSGGKTVEWDRLSALCEVSEFSEHVKEVAKYGFKLDVRRAKVGSSKHVRVRARFNVWSVRGTIAVTEEEVIKPDVLKSIWTTAGKGGLGDWRAFCKTPGAFGQYEAKMKPVR